MFKSLKLYKNFGFTLIELMIVIAIIGTLAGIAIPTFKSYREQAIMVRCISEIRLIEKELIVYSFENEIFPANLGVIGLGNLRDPWGNPYGYLRHSDAIPGKRRKDKNLVPVNTDFDLYSKGPDGKSKGPFTAKASRDDIVRANNGQYVGPVAGY